MIKIFSLRAKFILIILASTILPLLFLGYYTTIKFSKQIIEMAGETSEKITFDAQNNLMANINFKSRELSNFFLEARRDLDSFIFSVTMKLNDKILQNEYKGDSFIYWAMSDWENYLDKEKLANFLNQNEINDNYEKLKLYINDEDELKLKLFFEILLNGFDELNEENYQEKASYYPRFLITKEVFYDLKSISDKVIAGGEPYLFLNLMYYFLTEDGKSILNKGFSMMMSGKALVDNHESYKNLRLAYWGDNREGIEMIYSVDNNPLHPAIASIGNSYYCKSKFFLIDNNLEPVLQHSDILGDKKVSVLTYPIFEKFKDKNSPLIGFAEYWIDWTVFSQKLSDYNFYSDEHNFLVNNDGIVISDSDNKHLGLNVYEINQGMESLKEEIGRKKSAYSKFIKNNQEYYIFYNIIPDTGLSLFSIVPGKSFTKLAEDEKNHAISHIKEISAGNLAIIGIILIFIFIASFYFLTIVIKPLKNLNEAAMKISQGDLNVKIEKKSKDEIGILAENFNQMAEQLKKTRDQVDAYSRNLENEVKARTKELESSKKKMEDKLYELEIYSKATTERELKMIELKRQIKELEDKLKKNHDV